MGGYWVWAPLIENLADLLTEPEIMAAILTDTPQLARHPALKTINNILRVFVNKYYGGGEDKIRFSQLDLMEFFKAVLKCEPNDKDNWWFFTTAFHLLFAHL